MKGKILDTGIILGDDGKRYVFSQADVANSKNRSIESFIGSEVDFMESGANAQSIYIIYANNSNLNLNSFKEAILSSDIQGIKHKIFCSMGLIFIGAIFGLIPIVGWFISITCFVISFVLIFMALKALNYQSESKTLIRNWVIAIVSGIIVGTLAGIFIGGAVVAMFAFGKSNIGGIGVFAIICIAIGAIFVAYRGLLVARELAFITQQKYILYAFYLNIIGTLTTWIVIGYLILVAVILLYIFAFVKFSEIRKRTDSDVMPWF